jgi:nucleotide-binding universal stress UspA family protein
MESQCQRVAVGIKQEKKMKRFVCPVDFSDVANNAVEYSANLAKQFKAQLTLLHIAQEAGIQGIAKTDSNTAQTPIEHAAFLDEKLYNYRTMVEDTFAIKCEHKVISESSNIEQVMKNEIRKNAYDLIIMGTGGTSELSQFFLGTHTYSVIRKVKCPLLIIPDGCSYKNPEEIVYASDYKSEDVLALKDLIDFMKKFDPNITVLHVSKRESDIREEIFQYFKDMYKDKLKLDEINFQRIVNKNTALGIDDYVSNHDVDLLVLLTHKYSLLERIFHDSLTKKISLAATYPILINQKDF